MFTAALASLLLLNGCQSLPTPADSAQIPATPVVDTGRRLMLSDILPVLAQKRVVLVGETHDQYQHHLGELAVIEGIYHYYPNIAIGLEFFQQPFQQYLDQYVAGEIDEQTMLRKTEYYERWRFDYRLYKPILDFARAHRIPLIALNLPAEITEQVGRQGMQSLSAKQRAQIPATIDRNVPGYRERIENIFNRHPSGMQHNVDNFIDVQLLWDEGMAARAADYLKQHPDKHMIILAGSGHIIHGTGIPVRLKRRIDGEIATLVFGDRLKITPDLADYVLFPPKASLPRQGLIGVILASADQGLKVVSFSDDSLAPAAGMKKGDRIVEVQGKPVNSLADIRLALLNQKPHDRVAVTVLRDRGSGVSPQRLRFRVELR